jgi:hypothetical protein
MHGKPSSLNLVIDYSVDENAKPLISDIPPPRSATPVGAPLAPSRSSSAAAPPLSAPSSGPEHCSSDAHISTAPASAPEMVPSACIEGSNAPPTETLPAGNEVACQKHQDAPGASHPPLPSPHHARYTFNSQLLANTPFSCEYSATRTCTHTCTHI